MIDIHVHLLPDFDDGPVCLEETRDMLHMAWQQGIRTLVATPHILNNGDYQRAEEIHRKFQEVKKLIVREKFPLKVYLGSELYLQPDTTLEQDFCTLNNNGKYLLVEFTLRTVPEFTFEKIFEWVLQGYFPILAHPERNLKIIDDPNLLYRFAQMGVLVQVNSGSLLGKFGKKVKELVYQLMDHNLVHFVGSDAHGAANRPITLREAWEVVEENWGAARARRLFKVNPSRALQGKPLEIQEPVPFEEKFLQQPLWQRFLKKLRISAR